jgi:hypothetical protein
MSTVLDTGVIAEVVDAYRAEDLSSVPGARLDAEVVDLHQATSMLEAEQIRRWGSGNAKGCGPWTGRSRRPRRWLAGAGSPSAPPATVSASPPAYGTRPGWRRRSRRVG